MALTIQLPADVEHRLRAEVADLESEAKEAFALDLFRRNRLSHHELSKVLGLDRFETEAYLKLHNVADGSLTTRDLNEQSETLDRVLGPVRH